MLAGRKDGKMAKRRFKKSRRGGSKKLPLAIMVPMAVAGYETGKYLFAGDTKNAAYVMSGMRADGTFSSGRLIQTYAPIAAGVVVHKIAGRVGVNRYIPKWIPVSI